MKPITSRLKMARFPLTIGTPYGEVRLELEVCRGCGEHFNFRIVESASLLSTRRAEPFLYLLMNTLEAIGSELWLSLPPESVREAIASDTYKPPRLVVPASDA